MNNSTSNIFIFLLMIFCHIVDDYYLQGLLASLKQKDYWKANAPDKMYKYDYIVALVMHAFSWAFMVMLPIAYTYNFNPPILFMIVMVCNIITHAIIDDLKANRHKINLIVDQSIHIVQIVITYFLLA